MLSHAQIQQFKIDGYLVLRGLINERELVALRSITKAHLNKRIAPFELEAEVHYPGAPASTTAEGGSTIRRLKQAYHRDNTFRAIAERSEITAGIRQILGSKSLFLNPNHHNCVMTKLPQHSSETLWHRDTRYWHFSDKYLVNAWCALGDERQPNGAMKILPGSHRWDVRESALDEAQFLRVDHADNIGRLKTQRLVELDAGDVLLFSAHCFHAAGRNTTDKAKYSLVFTYHGESTRPLPDTTSDQRPELVVPHE
ncbi:phytanoyl-CoA dioxygenase [Arenicella chitinivorans]|uniref:Phytanoyl-CoA dioxygenase n=1 Tax=Arenicella chitinivorans TaxID=1329800 RepID=A0A918RHY8_9GAMM|nr:phytanoyl-CoA dioxygenase family protein [Arenicella chitinivorans]GHA00710.1 phytanoyl-CoA dioxygenase [Arenicella chitinivorans]